MSYEFDVKPSRYFPTVESMFKVYLGMHNRSIINSYNISPAERYSVSKIIIVLYLFLVVVKSIFYINMFYFKSMKNMMKFIN